ncbi:hypothetical protein [Paenibacillus aestuarii]|uniref:Uncharacterized protein n=1 Tax=Paenibacillus aestuarii TaxID=516965 RepID=A0ABW0KDZ7_9BACL|nr:hypothetical protein [Paenibacillus aestuarii]
MNRKSWTYAASGLLIGIILLISYWVMGRTEQRITDVLNVVQPQETLPQTPAPAVPSADELAKRMDEIRGWKQSEHRFSTDTDDPLILLQNQQQVVYVQHNQIRYEVIGSPGYPTIPLSVPGARAGTVWRNGTTAYIGLASSAAGSPSSAQGDWYEINLAAASGNPLKRLGDLQLSPEDVLSVTFANKPAGALFLEKTAHGIQEFWVHGLGKGQFFVNDYSPPGPSGRPPAPGADQAVFSNILDVNNMTILEDERGLLIAQNGAVSPTIFRLSGYKLSQSVSLAVDSPLRVMSPYAGHSAALLTITRRDGGPPMGVLLPANNPTPFPLSPKLMEPGWMLVDGMTFVRQQDGGLQVVSYPIPMSTGQGEAEPREASLSLAGTTSWSRSGMELEGEFNGSKKYLSLYDLINSRLEASSSSLWMNVLQPGRIVSADKPEAVAKEISVVLPKHKTEDGEAAGQADPAIPERLRQALEKRDAIGSGDLTNRHIIRQADAQWYVLTADQLESWDAALGFKTVGKLPVKVHCSTSNYAVCTSARDFVKIGDFWYVADTYADRIIKLDDSLAVVDQAEMEMPSRLSYDAKTKRLSAEGLSGTAEYTEDLKRVTMKPVLPTAIGHVPKDELMLWPEGYYEDPNGLHWAFQTNRLYGYDPLKQTMVSYFTGAMTNASGRAKLFPYMDKIWLLLDDRIHVFDSRGAWLNEIKFPRSQPDGIYNTSPVGEGSYVLDRDQGMLYLIQGYKLLQIDLHHRRVKPLLWQIQANMNKVLYDRGKLYVTLHTDKGNEPSDMSQELVICDTQTELVSRYKIPEGYVTDTISKDHELLLRQSSTFAGGDPNARMVYKLNEQGLPE